jgi:hypothetical protein
VRGYKKTAACYLLVLFRGQNIPTFVFIEEVQISNLPNPIIILTQHLKTASFVEHESHMGNCELGVPRSLNFQSQLDIKRTNFWEDTQQRDDLYFEAKCSTVMLSYNQIPLSHPNIYNDRK